MTSTYSTVIVGGGQAGLALSYYLTQHGHPHVVLEQAAQAGNAWRNGRWDSFTWVSPNRANRLPGMSDQVEDPDGFAPRDQIVKMFENYVTDFKLPVHFGVRVAAVEAAQHGYLVKTEGEALPADNVVVATGLFQKPKVPPASAKLSADIKQLHSGDFRNAQSLPAGAVLVVGGGQSGCQIAEDLYQNGRTVYLSTGKAPRLPRRYRGVDSFAWGQRLGLFDRTADMLPSPRAKFASNPQLSGTHGGHTVNLHQFARDGVILLGRLNDINGDRVTFTPDLKENLALADKAEADFVKGVEMLIQKSGMDLPPETLPQLRDGYDIEEILELDLRKAGITSLIWACGYSFDFSLVKFPVFDSDGFPITRRGVTDYPGLYFLGMPWIYNHGSGFIYGAARDAEYLAAHITARK